MRAGVGDPWPPLPNNLFYRINTAAATVVTTGNTLAAGFYLTQIGTPASLGTAGAANATNTAGADAAWTNPAGMTGIDSDVFVAGAQVVVPKMEFDPSRADAGGEDGERETASGHGDLLGQRMLKNVFKFNR